jgi:methionyl-tRNA formyltransferase
MRVLRTRPEGATGEPGEVVDAAGDGPVVAAGSGAVRLLEVQPEGRPAMTGAAWLHGHPLREGEKVQ